MRIHLFPTPQVSFCLLIVLTGLFSGCTSTGSSDPSVDAEFLSLQDPVRTSPVESAQAQALAAFSVALNRELTGDFPGALAAYEEAIRQDPENDALYMIASRQLIQAGRSEDAFQLIQSLIAKQPENTTARRWLAKWYLIQGEDDKAQTELLEAISFQPKAEIIYLEATQLALRNQDLPEVIRISRLANTYAENAVRSTDILLNLLYEESNNAPDVREQVTIFDEFLEILAKAIADFPEEDRFLLLEARMFIEANNWESALASYTQLDAQMGQTEAIRNKMMAHAIRFSGEGAKGVQNFAKALTPLADSNLSLYFLGLIGELTRQPQTALAAYRQAYALAPEDHTTLRKVAVLTYQNDQNREASALLEKALKKDPNDPEILLLAGQISLFNGDFLSAQRHLEKRLLRARQGETLSDPAGLYAQLSMAYLAQDLQQKAADAMIEAAAGPGNLEWIWQFRLQELYTLNQTDPQTAEAARESLIFLLEDIADRLPENPEVEWLIGRTQVMQKNYALAVEAFERYIPLAEATKVAEAWLNEGFYFDYAAACERNGEIEKSIALFEKNIANSPNHHPSLNYLAYMWAEQNQNLDQALLYSKRSLKLDPGNGSYLDTLGWIYYQQGQLNKAYQTLQKSAEVIPEESVVAEHLGDVMLKKERPWEAMAYYRIALELGAAERTPLLTRSLETAETAFTQSLQKQTLNPN